MSFPKVTIQLVTYNSAKYLPECLQSIFNQTYRDFQVLVIDNNSQDNTVEYLRRNWPQVAVFQNKHNVGFPKAHNQGIQLLKSPYVLLCNIDVVLEDDWLEKIMIEVESEKNSQVASFGGKLLKLKLLSGEIWELQKTDIIDSCGLKLLKNHQVVELGSGESKENFTHQQKVFGHSGALVMLRRLALEEIAIQLKGQNVPEYFDEDFFLYKEDVDLEWRLQLAGWSALFVPEAVAYHIRALAGTEGQKIMEIIKNKKKQSPLSKYYSYQNHFLLIIKNEFGKNIFKYLPQLMWYEFKKFIYILFFEIKNLKAIIKVFQLWPRMNKKRSLILGRAKVKAEDIRHWIN
ncbi:MAG: glycosyltransferase family 2 protein [bacterium]